MGSCNLYIALYQRALTLSDGGGTFHWALVPSEGHVIERHMMVYDIIDTAPTNRGRWNLRKGVELDFCRSDTFACLVKLPRPTIGHDQLCDFLGDQSPDRGGTPLLSTHRGKWSCSQWALRTLGGLADAGIIQLSLSEDREKEHFYRRVRSLGILSHSVTWPGRTEGGIKVIDHDYSP